MKKTLLSLLCIVSAELMGFAENEIAMIDVGGGLPSLLTAEASVIPLRHWHVGMGYGIAPSAGTGGPALKLDGGNTATLVTGTLIRLNPQLSHSFSTLTPFIRFFPNDTGFYAQGMCGILFTKSKFSSNLTNIFGEEIEGGTIGGSINNTILLPTLSLGHILKREMMFLNVNIGLTYLYDISTRVQLDATIPDSQGGGAANTAALNKLSNELSSEANEKLNEYESKNRFIPSFTLAIGIFL